MKQNKVMRDWTRDSRRRGRGKYYAVHTAERLGNVMNLDPDSWKWRRVEEVMDVMKKATEIWLNSKL
jgi:hypothetical protein